VIAGNHDLSLDKEYFEARRARMMAHMKRVDPGEVIESIAGDKVKDSKVHYLTNSSVAVHGFNIYGSPESAWFHDWAFNVDRGDPSRELYARIPTDTDILLTHGPPVGHCDEVYPSKSHEGDVDLLFEVESRIRPAVHAFGHIHESYGASTGGTIGPDGKPVSGTVYVNASTCTFKYRPTNLPIVIDLPSRAAGESKPHAGGGEPESCD